MKAAFVMQDNIIYSGDTIATLPWSGLQIRTNKKIYLQIKFYALCQWEGI